MLGWFFIQNIEKPIKMGTEAKITRQEYANL